MTIKFKAIICTALFVFICIGLIACSKGDSGSDRDSCSDSVSEYENDTVSTENNDTQAVKKDYSLVSENGKHYIVFDDISKYLKDTLGYESVGVDFSSIEELHNTVTKGLLSDSQKRSIARTFPTDADGNKLSIDFENLYNCIIPSGVSLHNVIWAGSQYVFSVLLEGRGGEGSLLFLPEEEYDKEFQLSYVNFFDNDLIFDIREEDLGDGKVAVYHSTSVAKLKKIRYSISDGEKTVFVDKLFVLEYPGDPERISSTVPYRIDLYCKEADVQYFLNLYALAEDPTDEWLFGFGATPYVDNEKAEK